MTVKLLTENHLELLTLKGGCTGSSECTLSKIPHCWKSHVMAQLQYMKVYVYNANNLKVSEYDQEIPQSQTADQPMVL